MKNANVKNGGDRLSPFRLVVLLGLAAAMLAMIMFRIRQDAPGLPISGLGGSLAQPANEFIAAAPVEGEQVNGTR